MRFLNSLPSSLQTEINKIVDEHGQGYTLAQLSTRVKHRNRLRLVRARRSAMCQLRQQTDMSYPEIAELFDCHHSTVMLACLGLDKPRMQ